MISSLTGQSPPPFTKVPQCISLHTNKFNTGISVDNTMVLLLYRLDVVLNWYHIHVPGDGWIFIYIFIYLLSYLCIYSATADLIQCSENTHTIGSCFISFSAC